MSSLFTGIVYLSENLVGDDDGVQCSLATTTASRDTTTLMVNTFAVAYHLRDEVYNFSS